MLKKTMVTKTKGKPYPKLSHFVCSDQVLCLRYHLRYQRNQICSSLLALEKDGQTKAFLCQYCG